MNYNDDVNLNISEDIEQGAKAAANTAKTARRVIANAASGNAAGAVLALFENKEARQIIGGILLFSVLLLVFVMYLFPMSVYEGIQSVIEDSKDAFWSAYYSDEGGKVVNGAWSFIKSFVHGLWSQLTNAIHIYTQTDTLSVYTEADEMIISEKDSPADAVYAKLKAAKDKYRIRKEEIISAIETQGYDAAYAKAQSYFTASFDADRDVFNGFVWDKSGCLKELPDLIAIKLAALYGVTNDNNFQTTRLADYMKWLGYKSDDAGKCTIYVLDAPVTVSAWCGTYMPQYLHDEAEDIASESANSIKEDIFSSSLSFTDFIRAQSEYSRVYRDEMDKYTSAYGVPAIDLVIKAYVSSSMTSTYQVAYRYMPEYSGTYRAEELLTNKGLNEEIEKYSDPDEGYIVRSEYTSTAYEYVKHNKFEINEYYYDTLKQEYYSKTHNGKAMPYRWTSDGGCYLPFENNYVSISFFQRYKIVTYTAYINVTPRTAAVLQSLTGLKEGAAVPELGNYTDNKAEYTQYGEAS